MNLAERGGWPPRELALRFIEGGARCIQVRAKTLASGACLDLCSGIVADARASGSLTIVNDRVDLAMLAGASGVHVGQDDLSPADVRGMFGERAIVGLSTHTVDQIERGRREPVTYLAVGPVFGTATKATGYEPVGLDLVRFAADLGLPVVAIGGITLSNVRSVLDAGAASAAVISDLLAGGDPTSRVKAILEEIARSSS